jgi:Rrf2 family protein
MEAPMRLTRAGEYALRAMRFLSSQTANRWFTIQEIANAEELPSQFLAKVMQHLTQAGLVLSACGKTGGYRLGKPATQITIGDVIVAMEGPLALNYCILCPEECRFVDDCRMHPIWEEVQNAILTVLRKYTMADVVQPAKDVPVKRQKGLKAQGPTVKQPGPDRE